MSVERRETGAAAWMGRSLVRAARYVGALSLGAAMILAAAPATTLAQPGPQEGFADLADRLKTAVVNITTSQTVERPRGQTPQFPPGSPFGDLFDDFFDENGEPRQIQSLGSGFIIDPSGIVVTNNHVIEGAQEIEVIFPDGTTLPATLIGRDPDTDLAALQIERGGPFDAVPWGDSDAVRVGDWVVAIGNPFGLGGSVSAGIISARSRDIQAGRYDDFLQTDAAINRGNSGGPLFNLDGEVVGVNTAIISPSGGSIGLGFSIPSNLAEGVIAQILEDGAVQRGWLGVRLRAVDESIAERIGLDAPRGVLVGSVTRDGPADKGGVQEGDVILTFAGEEVTEVRALQRQIAEFEVGAVADIDVWRDGETVSVAVEIGLLESDMLAEEQPEPSAAGLDVDVETIEVIGLGLAELSDELRGRFGLPETVEGVLIASVDPTSSAYEQGVRVGDVIVEVARAPAIDPATTRALIEAQLDSGRRSVLMMIARGSEIRHVAVIFQR